MQEFSDNNVSDYKELYHFHDDSSMVQSLADGRICMMKRLQIYDLSVFKYLMEHHNPHIPVVYSADVQTDGRLCVTEELISGCTLDVWLQDHSESERADVLRQICEGMAFLHHARPPIIHRDLKPSNIMITGDGTVKIIDYDAAKTFRPEEEKDTILIGTPGNAAPEQYGFGKVDERTDIYSIGIMIRQMFPGNVGLQEVADRATRLEPDERYACVEDLLIAVNACLSPQKIRSKDPAHSGDFRSKSSSANTDFDYTAGNKESSRQSFAFTGKDTVPVIRRIPGFRSGRPWKMIVAILGYLFIFYIAFTTTDNMEYKRWSLAGHVIFKLTDLSIGLLLVAFYTGAGHFFAGMRFRRSDNIVIMIMGYALGTVLIPSILIIIAILIETLLGIT